MLDKQKIDWLFNFIGKPALLGLVVAALLIVLFPQFRGEIENSNDSADDGRNEQRSSWSGPVSYAAAVSRAAPSVVNIYTKKFIRNRQHPLLNDPFLRGFFNYQQQRNQNSLGSGVVMQANGLIMTNNHVVDNVDEISVLLYDGRELPAVIVGTDADTDLAVLKIQADNLQPITVGEPMQSRIGDVVLAIGNPFGFGQSVTQGIISATNRNGLGLNTFENFIQTDADINPGNSGGALVDAYGNLLGISTAKVNQAGVTGMGFAIPADVVEKVLADIVKQGRVVRGWLGMDARRVTPQLVKTYSLGSNNGLLVDKIHSGSPAYNAGILPGDIVISINGVMVTDRHSSASQIADIMPGQPIKLAMLRGNKTFSVTAVAGTRKSRN